MGTCRVVNVMTAEQKIMKDLVGYCKDFFIHSEIGSLWRVLSREVTVVTF